MGGASFTGVAGLSIQGTTVSDHLVQGDGKGDTVADLVIEVRLSKYVCRA